MLLLLENDQMFTKILPKRSKTAKQSHFDFFEKNPIYMPRVVWAEESKTGLSFEIGQTRNENASVNPVYNQWLIQLYIVSIRIKGNPKYCNSFLKHEISNVSRTPFVVTSAPRTPCAIIMTFIKTTRNDTYQQL